MSVSSLNVRERVTLLSGPYAGQSGAVAMIVYDWQPNVDLVYVRLDGGEETVTRRISDDVARESVVATVEAEQGGEP